MRTGLIFSSEFSLSNKDITDEERLLTSVSFGLLILIFKDCTKDKGELITDFMLGNFWLFKSTLSLSSE
jgi:hypothetical protein